MFSTAPISHSRIRYPSSSDFSPLHVAVMGVNRIGKP